MDYYEERPAEVPPIDFEENTTTHEDDKWYGVPAKGEQLLPTRWKYVLMIIGIIILEICIWAIYRWSTAEFFGSFGTYQFYLLHIIAAPTIHLFPILLFWWLIRRERGHPFVFSKKLLLTGIIVGFMAAIIWRLIEEFVYDGFAGLAGGTVPGTLSFINLLETADLFILMTFVMYFVVGPVEELEFRGFTQDQGARVLPNWQAVILSSILFGCSHIPIAIFVYELHLVPTQFVDALFGWIAAGFTFGVLYMYSRNIFACIVMHGMGNWQLSVFYFMSRPAGMEPTTAMIVGIMTSLVANAIMIVIFYLINKYYWQPHRRGEPAFGGKFFSLQTFLHEHDFEKKPIVSTIVVFTIFIMIVSGIIMGAAAFGGSRPAWFFPSKDVGVSEGPIDLNDLVEVPEVITNSGILNDQETETITITSEPDKYIKEISVTVTWTDEPASNAISENQPDTFSVEIIGPNSSLSDSSQNPVGGQGSVSAKLTFTIKEIAQFIESDFEDYSVDVNITLEITGDHLGRVANLVKIDDDNSNQYNYDITIIWLTTEEES